MSSKKPVFGPASLQRESKPVTQLVTKTLPKPKRCPLCRTRPGTVDADIDIGVVMRFKICEPCAASPLAQAAVRWGPTAFDFLKRFL